MRVGPNERGDCGKEMSGGNRLEEVGRRRATATLPVAKKKPEKSKTGKGTERIRWRSIYRREINPEICHFLLHDDTWPELPTSLASCLAACFSSSFKPRHCEPDFSQFSLQTHLDPNIKLDNESKHNTIPFNTRLIRATTNSESELQSRATVFQIFRVWEFEFPNYSQICIQTSFESWSEIEE